MHSVNDTVSLSAPPICAFPPAAMWRERVPAEVGDVHFVNVVLRMFNVASLPIDASSAPDVEEQDVNVVPVMLTVCPDVSEADTSEVSPLSTEAYSNVH